MMIQKIKQFFKPKERDCSMDVNCDYCGKCMMQDHFRARVYSQNGVETHDGSIPHIYCSTSCFKDAVIGYVTRFLR